MFKSVNYSVILHNPLPKLGTEMTPLFDNTFTWDVSLILTVPLAYMLYLRIFMCLLVSRTRYKCTTLSIFVRIKTVWTYLHVFVFYLYVGQCWFCIWNFADKVKQKSWFISSKIIHIVLLMFRRFIAEKQQWEEFF